MIIINDVFHKKLEPFEFDDQNIPCLTSHTEQTNPLIRKRIKIINKLYSINEENMESDSYYILAFLTKNCKKQLNYWLRLMLNYFLIRPNQNNIMH